MIDSRPAAAFHASVLLPLARVNARQGVRYFASAPDPACETYWERPASRGGGVTEVATGADAAALLTRASEHWAAAGDRRLASLLPDLLALRVTMLEGPTAASDDAEVSISVYPLF